MRRGHVVDEIVILWVGSNIDELFDSDEFGFILEDMTSTLFS